MKFIQPFLKIIGYQGDVDKKKKKQKQDAEESSSPRKSLIFTIKKKKPSTTLISPLSDEEERDEIAEATLLSLTMHKTAITAEAQENVAKVQEKLMEEEIDKMIEPGSHKENLKNVDDDDDVDKKKDDKRNDANDDCNDDHTNHGLELTNIVSPTLATTSKDQRKTKRISNKTDTILNEIIPQIASRATDDLIKNNLKRAMADTVIQKRDAFQAKEDDAPPKGEKEQKDKRHQKAQNMQEVLRQSNQQVVMYLNINNNKTGMLGSIHKLLMKTRFLVGERIEEFKDMIQHKPHFILKIVDNSLGSLTMGTCVFLRLRRPISPYRDRSIGIKVLDGGRDVLKGGTVVVERFCRGNVVAFVMRQPKEYFQAGIDFIVPICVELIFGKSSGEGSKPNRSKQTEEAKHKESGDMEKRKEAATFSQETDE
nr:hypothetical protein [Tanacetum cinerariifolium]